MSEAPKHGVPELGVVSFAMLREALARGWGDMRARPGYGLFFTSIYVAIGFLMIWVTRATGQTYWLVFAAVSFPLIGPFASVGLYEVSRRIQQEKPMDPYAILGVISRQSKRQLPSICAVIIVIFLFWFFLAHMIFALFLGLAPMTNVSSSYEIFLSANGMMMLLVGSAVGAGFALIIYMITVISLPLLLDREVDFVTAMITSFQTVAQNPVPMFAWAGFIAVMTFVALLPLFLGLFLVMPLLGHATWHLYALMKETASTPEVEAVFVQAS